MLLVCPDLEGLGILLVNDPDTLKHSSLHIELGKLLLKARQELLHIRPLTCTLEVVNVRTEYQHETLRRGMRTRQ